MSFKDLMSKERSLKEKNSESSNLTVTSSSAPVSNSDGESSQEKK